MLNKCLCFALFLGLFSSAALADRIEYNDFSCAGVMPGEFDRSFTMDLVAVPEPKDRYVTITETTNGTSTVVWQGDVQTALIISGRGVVLQYELPDLRLEAVINAVDDATQTFPAYLAVQNANDPQDMISVQAMSCHVTSDGPSPD